MADAYRECEQCQGAIPKQIPCNDCDGEGKLNGARCFKCDGQGLVYNSATLCQDCGGDY